MIQLTHLISSAADDGIELAIHFNAFEDDENQLCWDLLEVGVIINDKAEFNILPLCFKVENGFVTSQPTDKGKVALDFYEKQVADNIVELWRIEKTSDPIN